MEVQTFQSRAPLPQEKVTLDQIIVFSLVFLPGFLPLFSPFGTIGELL